MHPYLKAEKILWELKFDFACFNMESFVRYVSQRTGREIKLIPVETGMSFGLFGFWISGSDTPVEHIYYRCDLSPMHRSHTLLHELAHILCGHPTLQMSADQLNEAAFEQAALRCAYPPLLRSPTKAQFDLEAETLADLIQKRVLRRASLDQLTGDLSVEQNFADYLKTMRLT